MLIKWGSQFPLSRRQSHWGVGGGWGGGGGDFDAASGKIYRISKNFERSKQEL